MLRCPMIAAGRYVTANHLADRLGLLPANIALMGVRHQGQPIAARLAANLHADASGIIARAGSCLTIGIGAAVDRVCDHPVNGGVVWAPPSRLAILALHRQIETVFVEPEERLPRAAKLQHLVEDQCNRFLNPAVWVFLVAVA